MISKHYTRLLKALRIKLGHKYAQWPVYYCPDDPSKNFKAVTEACRKIHEFGVLPWPSDRCIMVSEGWPFRNALDCLVSVGGVSGREYGVLGARMINGVPRVDDFLCFVFQEPKRIAITPDMIMRWARVRTLDAIDRSPLSNCSQDDYDELLRNARILFHIGLGGPGDFPRWTHANHSTSDVNTNHSASYITTWFNSTLSLISLANKITPCGYTTRSYGMAGCGMPSLKLANEGQPLIIQASWDRQWVKTREAESPDGEYVYDETIGNRQGHIYYSWQAAGVPKPDASMSPLDRLIYAKVNSVRSRWIHSHDVHYKRAIAV